MRRILFVLACLLAAQPSYSAERVWRLGVLTPVDWPTDVVMHTVLIPELARLGFVEGRNLVILPHWGNFDQLPFLAEDLAKSKPDVIVAASSIAVAAAMKASAKTPIVASFIGDPVQEGVAESLSRPGGNVTGLALLGGEGDKKRVQLLHETLPTAKKFGILADQNRIANRAGAESAASNMGVESILYPVNGPAEYTPAFDAMRVAGVEGVVILSSPAFTRDASKLAALALERRLPTICEWRAMAGSGCLIGYGPDIIELRLRTADFVARLFSGGNPAEMPFEQPVHFKMAINGKVAHAMGVAIPPSILIRSDELIE
jgi:putative tryptophan/tyrosine transport system substrate-binding protein